jgi:hypothetical protein
VDGLVDAKRHRGYDAPTWSNAVSDLTRSEKMLAEKTVCVLLVRGEDPDGQPIYAYVAVRADRLEEFMAAQKTGIFYPEEYGIIVEAGSGEPADEVKKRMESEYGFNHQAMLNIPDSESASEVATELTKSIAAKKSLDS